MAGPDGVRGEFVKGLYRLQRVYNVVKVLCFELHAHDTAAGSVLGDFDQATQFYALNFGEVPVSWCNTFVSAVFIGGDPTVLDTVALLLGLPWAQW